MRSIANNEVHEIPGTSQVCTVFVLANIQGEQVYLSCIEYVFDGENIKAHGCTKEEIREVIATVGFVPDGKAKPDHAVSTLSVGCTRRP